MRSPGSVFNVKNGDREKRKKDHNIVLENDTFVQWRNPPRELSVMTLDTLSSHILRVIKAHG